MHKYFTTLINNIIGWIVFIAFIFILNIISPANQCSPGLGSRCIIFMLPAILIGATVFNLKSVFNGKTEYLPAIFINLILILFLVLELIH